MADLQKILSIRLATDGLSFWYSEPKGIATPVTEHCFSEIDEAILCMHSLKEKVDQDVAASGRNFDRVEVYLQTLRQECHPDGYEAPMLDKEHLDPLRERVVECSPEGDFGTSLIFDARLLNAIEKELAQYPIVYRSLPQLIAATAVNIADRHMIVACILDKLTSVCVFDNHRIVAAGNYPTATTDDTIYILSLVQQSSPHAAAHIYLLYNRKSTVAATIKQSIRHCYTIE